MITAGRDVLEDGSKAGPWDAHKRWSRLFDAVCDAAELDSASELALLFCQHTGRLTQRDLETAARNIGNWRNGSHLPSSRNFRILTKILSVSQDPGLSDTWHSLYEHERALKKEGSGRGGQEHPAFRQEGGTPRTMRWLSSIALVCISAAGLAVALAFWPDKYTLTVGAEDVKENHIPYKRNITLRVGESAVIHGHRGACGQAAPAVEKTEKRLPTNLQTGILSVGRTGVRYSRHCKGETPAREVIMNARRAGSDRITIFGDTIDITVTD